MNSEHGLREPEMHFGKTNWDLGESLEGTGGGFRRDP